MHAAQHTMTTVVNRNRATSSGSVSERDKTALKFAVTDTESSLPLEPLEEEATEVKKVVPKSPPRGGGSGWSLNPLRSLSRSRSKARKAGGEELSQSTKTERAEMNELRDQYDENQRANEAQAVFESGWLFDPRSEFFKRWDTWTGLLLIFTALVTPWEVAFIQTTNTRSALFYINRLVDLTFISDLIMQFFLPYQDPITGEYCRHHGQIVRHYLFGWFPADILSTLPFDLVEVVTGADTSDLKAMRLVRLLRLVKLLRLLRTARMFQRWESAMEINYAMLDLYKFMVSVLTVAHWLACGWRMLVGITKEDSTRLNWVTGYELVNADNDWAVYLAALYWSTATLSTLGYGDVLPTNDEERAYVVFCTVVGGSIYAYMVGSVCGLLAAMNDGNAVFYKTMDNLNNFMREKHFPPALRWRLREYFRFRRDNDMSDNQHELLVQMSHQIRAEVAEHVHAKWINEVTFFRDCPREFVTELALNLKLELFSANEYVVKEGTWAHKMFIVEKGLVGCEGLVKGSGKTFGAEALGSAARRHTYCAMTLSNCVLLTLHKKDLESILSYYPDVRVTVRKKVVRSLCKETILRYTRAVLAQSGRAPSRRALGPDPAVSGPQMQSLLVAHKLGVVSKEDPEAFQAIQDATVVMQKNVKMRRARTIVKRELSFRRHLRDSQAELVMLLEECALSSYREKMLTDHELDIDLISDLTPEGLCICVGMPLGSAVRLLRKIKDRYADEYYDA